MRSSREPRRIALVEERRLKSRSRAWMACLCAIHTDDTFSRVNSIHILDKMFWVTGPPCSPTAVVCPYSFRSGPRLRKQNLGWHFCARKYSYKSAELRKAALRKEKTGQFVDRVVDLVELGFHSGPVLQSLENVVVQKQPSGRFGRLGGERGRRPEGHGIGRQRLKLYRNVNFREFFLSRLRLRNSCRLPVAQQRKQLIPLQPAKLEHQERIAIEIARELQPYGDHVLARLEPVRAGAFEVQVHITLRHETQVRFCERRLNFERKIARRD